MYANRLNVSLSHYWTGKSQSIPLTGPPSFSNIKHHRYTYISPRNPLSLSLYPNHSTTTIIRAKTDDARRARCGRCRVHTPFPLFPIPYYTILPATYYTPKTPQKIMTHRFDYSSPVLCLGGSQPGTEGHTVDCFCESLHICICACVGCGLGMEWNGGGVGR